MKAKWIITIASLALVVAMTVPIRVTGHNTSGAFHHHYKLIVLPTLGGTNSTIGGEVVFGTLNNQGDAVAQGDTTVAGVSQVYSLQNGIQTDFQVLPAQPGSPPNSAYPNWVNQWGLAVGVSTTSVVDPIEGTLEGHAVLWTPNGSIFDLGTLGGYQSEANAVNDFGQVTGWVENTTPDPFSLFGAGAQTQAFIWQFGVMHRLGTLGGPDSNALFINDLGQVAGCSLTNDTPNPATDLPTYDAFIWQNGKMTDLNPGNFGGTQGCANFLNNRGQIVGFMTVADESNHPFLWDHGKITDLFTVGNLGGLNSSAHAVNMLGHVAGDSFNSLHFRHAVVWRNGGIVDLGLLNGAPCSDAYILNSSDQVVGTSGPCDESTGDAFLWENGSLVDLNTLIPADAGIQLQFAFWINESGEIAGDGILTASGDGRGFLLIPCDENHPGIEGCDYSLVDAATAADVRVPLAAQKSATSNLKGGVPADLKPWWRAGARRNRFAGIEPPEH